MAGPVLAVAEKTILCRLLKNTQMLGPRNSFPLPVRQAIPTNEVYYYDSAVRRSEGNDADGRFSVTC